MRRSNFALRLQPSLLEELRKAAELEGVALNQLINVAVAEKVSALRTEEYFQERGRRANRAETLRILERAGKGNPPVEGDELPREGQKKLTTDAGSPPQFHLCPVPSGRDSSGWCQCVRRTPPALGKWLSVALWSGKDEPVPSLQSEEPVNSWRSR
jgi:hypothetical protein